MAFENLTRHLGKAVETRAIKPSFFAAFFLAQDVHNQELVEFDTKSFGAGIAPFVNPLKDGKPVEIEGYDNNILKLPTIKPSKILTSGDLSKKPFGKAVYDATSKNAQARELMTDAIDDNGDRIDVRLEVMRIDASFNGSLTIVGEGEDRVVNFGRDAANTVDLGAGFYWDDTSPDIDGDMRDFIKIVAGNGYSATHIVGRSESIAPLIAEVKTETDFRRVENGGLKFQSMLDVNGAIYEGTYLNIEIWSYDGVYKDAAGATQKAVPEKKVVVMSAVSENEMSYGYAGDVVLELDMALDYSVDASNNTISKVIPNRSTVEVESVLTGAPLLKGRNSTLVATVLK